MSMLRSPSELIDDFEGCRVDSDAGVGNVGEEYLKHKSHKLLGLLKLKVKRRSISLRAGCRFAKMPGFVGILVTVRR